MAAAELGFANGFCRRPGLLWRQGKPHHPAINMPLLRCLVVAALVRPQWVAGSASITDDERLLHSDGTWHRAQRKQIPFHASCYYTHETAMPHGCQFDVSRTGSWTGDPERSKEREVLHFFYQILGGGFWRANDNWNEGDPCWDAWYGVTCNEHGYVIALQLSDNRLEGFLPPNFGDLSRMLKLDLSSTAPDYHGHPNVDANRVRGPMPSLRFMRQLEEIEVSGNEITALPLDLRENAGTLRSLSASFNRLTALPLGLRHFTALHTLELAHNSIGGSFPVDIGDLTNARFVQLEYNRLSGAIPSQIVGMRRCRVLDLSHNPGISGELPENIIVDWQEQDYIAILNTSISGYIASLCLDVPFCYKFMYDTHKDLTWATAADVPDIVKLTVNIAMPANPEGTSSQ